MTPGLINKYDIFIRNWIPCIDEGVHLAITTITLNIAWGTSEWEWMYAVLIEVYCWIRSKLHWMLLCLHLNKQLNTLYVITLTTSWWVMYSKWAILYFWMRFSLPCISIVLHLCVFGLTLVLRAGYIWMFWFIHCIVYSLHLF